MTPYLTFMVGLASALIGIGTLSLATAKYRMDLYNRRLAIYLAALDLYRVTMDDDAEATRKSYLNFITSMREAQFLFSARSRIEPLLERLRDEAWNILILRSNRDLPDMEEVNFLLWKKSFGSGVHGKMQGILSELEWSLRPYLTYRIWDWKFWRYWFRPSAKKKPKVTKTGAV